MQLNLSRPLVFFDLETSGLQVGHDHIVEMCFLKINPDGTEEQFSHRVRPVDVEGRTVHIPEETTAIHGISDEDVMDMPSFRELAPQVVAFIGDADLAGYNSNKFDVPMLVEEFLRAGQPFDIRQHRLIDVQNIFHRMEQRTLRAAYRFYCGGQDFANAHSADADTRATYEVLKAQLDRYRDVDCEVKEGEVVKAPVRNDVQALSDFSSVGRNADLVGHIVFDAQHKETFNFGKYKNRRLEDVFVEEPSYCDWMLKSDFPLSTKSVVREVYGRVRQQQSELRRQAKPAQHRSDFDGTKAKNHHSEKVRPEMTDEQVLQQLSLHFSGKF
ncbi:MAG: 3'-5' exonuclease [Bacteroidales bacterium]|nr:3'-5' exonuclease [Bacteroidales bacterium]